MTAIPSLFEFAKKIYRTVALPLIGFSGGFAMLRSFQKTSALVLTYHAVIDTHADHASLINVNQVSLDAFHWQLRFVKNHYTVVPLSEIVRRIRAGRPISRLAAITFDDGYYSVFKNAGPVLSDLDLTATVFLIVGLVGKNALTWYDKVEAHLLATFVSRIGLEGHTYDLSCNRENSLREIKGLLKTCNLPRRDRIIQNVVEQTGPVSVEKRRDYRLMNWSEIEQLRGQGIDFGVHSCTHPHLTRVAPLELVREIDNAARELSRRLSTPVEDLIFCYPDGDYNQFVRDQVARTGMLGAVAVDNKLVRQECDVYALPRVGVSKDQTSAMFDDATVGLTQWIKGRMRLLAL